VQYSSDLLVVDVTAATGQQARVLCPLDARTDEFFLAYGFHDVIGPAFDVLEGGQLQS
jgi:hypothetical protein